VKGGENELRKRNYIVPVLLSFVMLIQKAVAESEIVNSVPKEGLIAIGIGLLLGLAGLGAALGMGMASSSACGAICERPELYGRTMIFIVFIEAIAIYALVISLMLSSAVIG
jgi:V/A-type H+-transporting ATPase subunit K